MPIIDEGGGGGGGPVIDRGVCSISPSDLVGYTGNALNRIMDLEQRVAELESRNVEVNQLSDLSQQVGWVSGIEYMGIPGWTQTEYGTLIPPPDIHFEVRRDVTGWFDADGNFLFGNETNIITGQMEFGGTLVDQWNGVGKLNTYNAADTISYSTSPSSVRSFTNFTIEEDDDLVSSTAGGEISLASTGFYLVGWGIQVQYPSGAGSDKTFLSGLGSGSGWYTGLFQRNEATGGNTYNFLGSTVFRNDGSPNSFYLQVADSGTASGTRDVDLGYFYIIKLRGL